MSVEENKALVQRRYDDRYDEIENKHNIDAADDAEGPRALSRWLPTGRARC